MSEYLVPPGTEVPKAPVRDVSKDKEDAIPWIKENVKQPIDVHEARAQVQAQFPALTNQEAFDCVLVVKAEWEPKVEVEVDVDVAQPPV